MSNLSSLFNSNRRYVYKFFVLLELNTNHSIKCLKKKDKFRLPFFSFSYRARAFFAMNEYKAKAILVLFQQLPSHGFIINPDKEQKREDCIWSFIFS